MEHEFNGSNGLIQSKPKIHENPLDLFYILFILAFPVEV